MDQLGLALRVGFNMLPSSFILGPVLTEDVLL